MFWWLELFALILSNKCFVNFFFVSCYTSWNFNAIHTELHLIVTIKHQSLLLELHGLYVLQTLYFPQ